MKKKVIIGVVLSVLLLAGILCILIFTRQNNVDYVKEHSGLDLAGKYETVEKNLRQSGIAIYRYQIKKDAEAEIRQYIQDNWKNNGMRGIDRGMIPKDKMYAKTEIDQDLYKDEKYVTVYSFMWTPAPGLDGSHAKTDEMNVIVVDKPDGMYIVTV